MRIEKNKNLTAETKLVSFSRFFFDLIDLFRIIKYPNNTTPIIASTIPIVVGKVVVEIDLIKGSRTLIAPLIPSIFIIKP